PLGLQLGLPFVGGGANHFQVVMLRLPRQRLADSRGFGNQFGGIAGAARSILYRKPDSRYPLHRLQHFAYAEPASIPAVERVRGPPPVQVSECVEMRTRQVFHMDIVAYAGAIRGRIVGPEDG